MKDYIDSLTKRFVRADDTEYAGLCDEVHDAVKFLISLRAVIVQTEVTADNREAVYCMDGCIDDWIYELEQIAGKCHALAESARISERSTI